MLATIDCHGTSVPCSRLHTSALIFESVTSHEFLTQAGTFDECGTVGLRDQRDTDTSMLSGLLESGQRSSDDPPQQRNRSTTPAMWTQSLRELRDASSKPQLCQCLQDLFEYALSRRCGLTAIDFRWWQSSAALACILSHNCRAQTRFLYTFEVL